MSHERLVGLDVGDEAGYAAYREGMLPILARFGGAFRYDFRVAETLRAETSRPINRVFPWLFPRPKTKPPSSPTRPTWPCASAISSPRSGMSR